MQPGSLLTLDIEKPAAGGRMLARHQGQVVLVWGAIPGERVSARVERVGKGVIFADTAAVLNPSDDRRSDVGDWRALRAELAQSPGQVVAVGRSLDLGSTDVLIHSSGGRLVVTVGLRDMIVVDTPDVVLVCDADRTQEVRKIVEQLAAAKDTDHL